MKVLKLSSYDMNRRNSESGLMPHPMHKYPGTNMYNDTAFMYATFIILF